MKIEHVKLSAIKSNPNNPRLIKDNKFKKLVQSIKDFPEMLKLRPIVVNDDMIVLGGNMRLKACKEAGLKDVPIIKASDLSEDQQREFIIKDNVGFGEWDWDMIANEWDTDQIQDWGLDLPQLSDDDGTYTSKVDSPIYTPSGKKPSIKDLFNLDKYNKIIFDIDKSNIEMEEKEFLKLAATRHIEFNYRNAANYYSQSGKETQEHMENSALVIIDYNKAIEHGFVELTETINDLANIDG